MFAVNRQKVEANPLRQLLIKKGHSVRSAAQELGMNHSEMTHKLDAYQSDEFAEAIKTLPKREPAKMKTRKRSSKKVAA